MARLREELALTSGFRSLEDEVYISLVRATWQLDAKVHRAYAQGKLSFSQYNVLRILRGHGEPLSCSEISHRMVTRDSDLTRLLRGLETRGLVERHRAADDSRRVDNQITPEGRSLMKELDGPVAEAIESQLSGLGQKKLETLARLLEEVRQAATEAG
jgi:DNA-binding MarR family transcriptional regulator